MNLNYTDEQTALKASAEKLLKERYGAGQRGDPGCFWKTFADLGWLGLLHASDRGGSDGSPVDVALLAEAMGNNLVAEPFVSSVFASALVEGTAGDAHRAMLAPDLAAGRLRLLVAHEEPGGTIAATADAADRLTGVKSPILDAAVEIPLLVSARRPDATMGLFRVEAADAAMSMFPTVDGRSAARVVLSATPAVPLNDTDATAAIELAFDQAVAAQLADLCGAMQAALDASVSYAKIRQQFGQPIGANQVIKHRLVQMAVHCEEARSLVLLAAIRAGDGSPVAVRSRAISGAKIKILRMARAVTEDAVQIHGGMGVTDELEVGAYLKRVIASEATLGTVRWHRRRYRGAGADTSAEASV